MSVESFSIALNHSRATGSARLIVIGIANHDGDGGAWPSQATLSRYAGGITRARVKAATDKLVELGEIAIERNAGGGPGLAEWERPHLYRFLLKCPETCDRSSQHRDRTKHRLSFDAASLPIPGGVSEIPQPVSDNYPPEVSPAQQEPPSKPLSRTKRTDHSTRECQKSPTGEHNWEPSGWCSHGEHRRLEAVSA